MPAVVRYAFQYPPPRARVSLRAVKLPAGQRKAKLVALSSQVNQPGVPTVIGLPSFAGRTSVVPSTRGVVRAMALAFHVCWGLLGMLCYQYTGVRGPGQAACPCCPRWRG